MGCGISNVAACTAPQVGAACRFSRSSAGEPAEAAGAPTITTAERPWQLRGGDSHHHRVVEARETSPGPAAVFLRGTRSAAVGVHAANRQQTRVLSPVQVALASPTALAFPAGIGCVIL